MTMHFAHFVDALVVLLTGVGLNLLKLDNGLEVDFGRGRNLTTILLSN
jgi:hypothetical protein